MHIVEFVVPLMIIRVYSKRFSRSSYETKELTLRNISPLHWYLIRRDCNNSHV